MLRGIRTRLLGLVVATVVPFTALIGGGLWNQWRGDQAQATRSALIEARLLAARVDDQISELDSLLVGLSQAISVKPDPRSTARTSARRSSRPKAAAPLSAIAIISPGSWRTGKASPSAIRCAAAPPAIG
jgi:hypothetical protein